MHSVSHHSLHRIYNSRMKLFRTNNIDIVKICQPQFCFELPSTVIKQDTQLSQRDRAAGCVIVFAKSRRLELGDNILQTL